MTHSFPTRRSSDLSIQHPMNANGFVFLAREDGTGMMNITLRPDVYRRYRAVLHRHPLLVIDGRLQVEGAVLNVVARHLEPVETVIAEDRKIKRLNSSH